MGITDPLTVVTLLTPQLEVPQPSEPVTRPGPVEPVTPVDPDPGTPAAPEQPATVPGPVEPATPVVPDPEQPNPDPKDVHICSARRRRPASGSKPRAA